MAKPIISVSGLRGIIGESLTPALAAQYALGFSRTLQLDLEKPGSILLARDGRISGMMLLDAVSASLVASGWDVLDAGICATPTVGVLVRECRCQGAIQISASHNPIEYNGMKLFGADGRVINSEKGRNVMDFFEEGRYDYASVSQLGRRSSVSDTTSQHLQAVLKTVDIDRIRQKNYRVILDSNHGAGSVLGRLLLSALNCDFEILGETPDGDFAHTPEPTSDNLTGVSQIARDRTVDVVFCQDPDADRLAIIDEEGSYVGEEYTVALTLRHALGVLHEDERLNRRVVINCATSRMSVDIANDYGVECLISPVGEANVTDMMISNEAIYGGEGNGGPIDPRVGYVRDSFVGMAQVLDAMSATGQSLSTLVSTIRPYAIVKSKVEIETSLIDQAFDRLCQHFTGANANRMDGLRLDFEDSWLLVRASNTEPIVRVIAEGLTEETASLLVEQATGLIHSRS